MAPVGRNGLQRLIAILGNPDDERVPAVARASLAPLVCQFGLVNDQVLENDRRVRASARSTELGCRLMEVPGVGPVLASAMVATVPDPTAFKSGRNLAAWIGLVPRQNSSGGKEKLGGITKQGDRYLRQLLVAGALAVIRYAQRHGTKRPWLVQSARPPDAKDRGGRAGQQDGTHRLGVAGQRRHLSGACARAGEGRRMPGTADLPPLQHGGLELGPAVLN